MWRVALQKELIELRRDGRLRALVLIGAALMLSSTLLGYYSFQTMAEQHRLAQARSHAQWLEQGSKNPHSAAHFGIHAFRQPSPLSVFERGLLSYSGASVFLEAHKQNLPVHATAQDSTLARRLGEWAPANVSQTLLPLMCVLFMFGAVAHEREQGSLHLLRSLGSPLQPVAWAKLCAAGLALTAAVLPGALVGTGLAMNQGSFTFDLVKKAIALGLAYGLYLLCFLALCLAGSMRARTARQALVCLLGLWMAWVVVLPKAVTNAAANAHPLPRWAEIEHRLAADQGLVADSERPHDERMAGLLRETLAKHGVADEADLPFNFNGTRLIAGESWADAVFDEHFGKLYRAYRAQDTAVRRAGWLVPILALRSLSMDLAGTGLADELAFRRAAEAHRRDLVLRMNKAVLDHQDDHLIADETLWSTVPPFEYSPPSALSVLGHHAGDLAALALWATIGLLAVYSAARNLEHEASR